MHEREAIEYLVDLGRNSFGIHNAPDYPTTGRYFLRTPDGLVEERFATRPPRSIFFTSLTSMCEALANHSPDLTVTYSQDLVQALLETVIDGRTVSYAYSHRPALHDSYAELHSLCNQAFVSQRELLRALRYKIPGAVPASFIETLERLRVASSDDTGSVVMRGREAVDRRIAQQVQAEGGKDVPERLTFSVPVLATPEMRNNRYSVPVLVEIASPSPGEMPGFHLWPEPNALTDAVHEAVEDLGEVLESLLPEGTRLLCGQHLAG